MSRESILSATQALVDELERLWPKDEIGIGDFERVFELIARGGASLLVSPGALSFVEGKQEDYIDAFHDSPLARIMSISDPHLAAAVLAKAISLTDEILPNPDVEQECFGEELSPRDKLISDTYQCWCYSNHNELAEYTMYAHAISAYNTMFGDRDGAGEDFRLRSAPMIGLVESLPVSASGYRGTDGCRSGILCSFGDDLVEQVAAFNAANSAEILRVQRNRVLISTYMQVREQRRYAVNPDFKTTLDPLRTPLTGRGDAFKLFTQLPRRPFALVLGMVGQTPLSVKSDELTDEHTVRP